MWEGRQAEIRDWGPWAANPPYTETMTSTAGDRPEKWRSAYKAASAFVRGSEHPACQLLTAGCCNHGARALEAPMHPVEHGGASADAVKTRAGWLAGQVASQAIACSSSITTRQRLVAAPSQRSSTTGGLDLVRLKMAVAECDSDSTGSCAPLAQCQALWIKVCGLQGRRSTGRGLGSICASAAGTQTGACHQPTRPGRLRLSSRLRACSRSLQQHSQL